jgi:hypothetical protein
MKKTTIKKNHHVINLPEIVDMDTLSYASDDELLRRMSHLVGDKDKAARNGYELTAWETEICYTQRELSIRQDRRVAHEKYLSSNDGLRSQFENDGSALN